MKDGLGSVLGGIVGFLAFLLASGLFVLFAWPVLLAALLVALIIFFVMVFRQTKQP